MTDFNRTVRAQRITVEGPGAGSADVQNGLWSGKLAEFVSVIQCKSPTSISVTLTDPSKAEEVANEVERLAAQHSS